MRHHLASAAFMCLTLAGLAGCAEESALPSGAGGGASSDGCGVGTLAPGEHEITIEHGGLTRSYLLYLPAAHDGATRLPLVLNFHGLTSTNAQQRDFSAMNPTADAHGFAVAYPQGYEKSWNGGACCGDAMAEDIDDVGFARAVVADIERAACVDDKRVYSTGMSNGGIFSHRLACEAADLLAAVAPVCGPLLIACEPSRPMPLIHFYGTADPLVDYVTLGTPSNTSWLGTDGCSRQSDETLSEGAASCETHASCDAGSAVTFCSIEGMGHCWPGQSLCPPALGEANTDISANEVMWSFLESYTLP